MANVLVDENSLSDIADAIRSKKGVSTTYKPSEMADAISSIGGGVTPSGTKQITTNGTHDVTQYASAQVNVSNSYSASDEGKVVDNGALVSQTSRNITENGTYDTTTNDEVVVNVASNIGDEFSWASVINVVTVGANSVTNTSGVQTYFSSYSYDLLLILDPLTVSNQFVAFAKATALRYKGNAIQQTTVGAAYDAKLVEGTRYLLLKY